MDISLEGGGRVSEPEWHHHVFEVTVSRTERSLPLIASTDTDTVIRILYVDL